MFGAAEETLEELLRVIKKLANANASNIVVTADHGFIYQHHPLQDSDFLSSEPSGDEIRNTDRRFVFGARAAQVTQQLQDFSAAAVGAGKAAFRCRSPSRSIACA